MAVLTLLTLFCALASACAQNLPRPGPVAAGGGGGVAGGGGPGGAAAGGGGGAATGGLGGPFPRVAQQGQGGEPGQLGDLYAHLDAELEGQQNDDIEGHVHVFAFSVDNTTFNLLYVISVMQVPEQAPPTNATITSKQNDTVLFIPATWRETTGQPGFKMEDGGMMNCTDGMMNCSGYSYAAAGYWPNVNPTLVDLVTRMVEDPESYRAHVALPPGEDVNGKFELA